MIFSPNKHFFFVSFSNEQKLDKRKKKKKKKKKKKIFRPTDPNLFRHVSGNTGIFNFFFIPNKYIHLKHISRDLEKGL